MTTLTLTYGPEHDEPVEAEHVAGNRYRLTEHPLFVPLAPGDVVSADDAGNVTGLVEARDDLFVVEVFFRLDDRLDFINAKVEQWRRATDVTVSTARTCFVSSTSHQWITDVVKPHAGFDLQLVRQPGQRLRFEELIQRA